VLLNSAQVSRTGYPVAVNAIIQSVESEYRRYQALAEGALAQVPDGALCEAGPGEGNSLATIGWHMANNLESRFTEFLTSDGEKPWRDREDELSPRVVTRAELMAKWERGWKVLLDTLATLSDDDLMKLVKIRGRALPVHEALHRSLAHASYHVGQIVYLAHAKVGAKWSYLSIPPGESDEYNANPRQEGGADHARKLSGKPAA
jgi:hypothetical protein